jgi:CCR4-NOT transcription complex subunit 7/8
MGNAQLQAAFGGGPSGIGPAGLGRSGLESDAARMGFAHGAAMQQQQAAMGPHGGMDAPGLGHGNVKGKGMTPRIREVWKGNLEDEFKILMSLVEKYPYISMVGFIPA